MRGDQIVEVKIVVPKVQDERSKEILRELAEAESGGSAGGDAGGGMDDAQAAEVVQTSSGEDLESLDEGGLRRLAMVVGLAIECRGAKPAKRAASQACGVMVISARPAATAE